MQIEIWDIARLIPSPKNPKKITQGDVEKLAALLERQGFVDPLHVRQATGEIIAGHRRLLAAKHLGLARLPVIAHDISEDEADELRISLTRSEQDVSWDRDALANELVRLDGLGIDLTPDLLGFSEKEIGRLFDLDRGLDEPAEADKQAGTMAPQNRLIRPGDRWQARPITIEVNADTEPDKVEKLLAYVKKQLKAEPTLDGQPFKAVIASRKMEAMAP